ncbi:RICIN domain-containing protein [Pseudomonas sp. St316]|uniref:RICIN domain-containing protein n=1 Tax=Pseudomonas sp. St316 TaxID=2678257 RepID=UPI001BB32C11|nr:RICIN domain-containing protein [Pseudomonas sp. St316]
MRDKTAQDKGVASERKYGDDPGPNAIVEGIYRIATNLNHGRTIQMDTNNMAEPRTITLWPDNDTLQNLWRITYEAEYNAHIITNQHNVKDRSIFVADESDVFAGVRPILFRPQHFWDFETAGSSLYVIKSKHNGRVLDVRGSNIGNGTRIIAWPYGGTTNQVFKLVRVGN